jgi:pyrrolysine biosynthesis protein PylD
MTRLTSRDVKRVPNNIARRDQELKRVLGAGLLDVARLAAGFDGDPRKAFHNYRCKVVPMTCGKGMIPGFAEAVAAILNYIGLKAEVASKPDVGGFAEALRDGCHVVFAADDEFFVGFNFKTLMYTYNFDATGRAYAAALEIKAGGLSGKAVALIGAGRVGSAAADYLCRKGAKVYVYDIVPEKARRLKEKYPGQVNCCDSIASCISKANLVLLAAPGKNLIPASLVNDEKVFAVPAVPLGLSPLARAKIRRENLIHDKLELGVATMAVDLMKWYIA